MNLQKVSPTEAQNRPFKQKAPGQHYPLLLLAKRTPHPNPNQPFQKQLQHNDTDANAHEYEVTPPFICWEV